MGGSPGNTTASDVMASQNLSGKVAIVTGGDSGLGYAMAEALARQGATVVIGGHNQTKAAQAAWNISTLTGAEVVAFSLDLASFASVRSFAKTFRTKFGSNLQLLINNAGIGSPSVMSADGFELVFEVDYLGHFLLTELLLPALRASKPARVVNVASAGHTEACTAAGWPEGCFKDWTYIPPPVVVPPPHTFIGPTYGLAKFFQIQHAKGLAQRETNTGVDAFSVNPGYCLTPATHPHVTGGSPHLTGGDSCKSQIHPRADLPQQACPFSAAQGAAVIAFAATVSNLQGGTYYDRKFACEEGEVVEHRFTEAMVPELYERSLGWAGLNTSSVYSPALAVV